MPKRHSLQETYKVFGFIKKGFSAGLTNLSSLMGVTSLRCISMTNKECKVRP